jgi:23S rRNA pseudouridine2605 synthase
MNIKFDKMLQMKTNIQTQRLDKFLANKGLVSRRGVKNFLKENAVTINKKKANEGGLRINLSKDKVEINGKNIKENKFVYYLLNKPKGVISSSSDELGRTNVTDLIPERTRIYPVGRLDKDTHGLLLLTNDGELTHKLTHPKFHIPKTYLLTIKGSVHEEKIEKLRKGIILSDGKTRPAKVEVVIKNEKYTILEMEIFEGRYRQIRRMCETIRINLTDLARIKFGSINIGDLKDGKFRILSKKEIEELQTATA